MYCILYLKGTKDDGLILCPKQVGKEFLKDIYIDAKFARNWGFEDPKDPTCVKSRTGFIIKVMGCPIFWQSKVAGMHRDQHYGIRIHHIEHGSLGSYSFHGSLSLSLSSFWKPSGRFLTR